MKYKYLGTAAAEGWPGIFCSCEPCKKARKNGGKDIRTRSGALINDTFMVDFPPDTYHHVLTFGLDLSQLRHLVITHSHEDHFFPDDIQMRRAVFAHIYDDSVLEVYGNRAVQAIMTEILDKNEEVRKRVNFTYLPPFETFDTGDIKVTPLLALHNRNEDCYIYMFEDQAGKRVLYGNDTGIFPEETWNYIAGKHFDMVSLDCTTGPLPDGNNHMGIPDNAKVKERMIELGCADENTKFIITHFSHGLRSHR